MKKVAGIRAQCSFCPNKYSVSSVIEQIQLFNQPGNLRFLPVSGGQGHALEVERKKYFWCKHFK